jgi:threonine aldolase
MEVPGIDLDPARVPTNIFMMGIAGTGLEGEEMSARLRRKGVLVSALDSKRIRLVTHKDVNREQIYQAAEIIKNVVKERG